MFPDREDTQRIRRSAAHLKAVEGPRDTGVVTVLKGPAVGAVSTVALEPLTVGRSPEAGLSILDRGLSRIHARIVRENGGFVVEDMGSTNGTFVDGQRITGPTPLADGARIELGAGTILRFGLHDAIEAEAAHRSHELTIRDPLTATFNRRYMDQRLESEVAFARRHEAALSLLMIDIDGFKRLNDEHGHVVGDAALRYVARVLEAMVRSEDVVARYGGEEFLVLARSIGIRGAAALAERLRAGVEREGVETASGTLPITVSVGVAHLAGSEELSVQALVEAADEAMYEAKRSGRNRVIIAAGDVRQRLRSGMRSRIDGPGSADGSASG